MDTAVVVDMLEGSLAVVDTVVAGVDNLPV